MRALTIREERAQATVEMAIVTPVLLVLALIVYNAMMFASAVARFDRVAPDIVIAHGVSPTFGEDGGRLDASVTIASHLEEAMDGYGLDIEVSSTVDDTEDDGSVLSLMGALRTYTCVMRYAPWPSGLSIAGVEIGAPVYLSHERAVTIDPWRSGVVI